MDKDYAGKISFEERVEFATEKLHTMNNVFDFNIWRAQPEEFARYCYVAVSSRGSEENKSQNDLCKTFVETDVRGNWAIRTSQLDLTQVNRTRVRLVINFSWQWRRSAVNLSASMT